MNGGEQPAPRTWPPGRALDDATALAVRCGGCGLEWRVHDSLAGFRLRCECDAWLALPPPAVPPPALLPEATATPGPVTVRRADGLIVREHDPGRVDFTPIDPGLPMAPGTLVDASPTTRARWTNRTILELAAMLAALLAPQVAVLLLAHGRETELLLPFASLASGVLVAVLLAFTGPYGRMGFTPGSLRHHAEAIAAAAAGLLLAVAWVAVLRRVLPDVGDPIEQLRDRLGLAATLFSIAVAPAVLEEIVFRGLLQGRLLALLGERAGLVTTAAAFAVCHGMPAVLPIHFALGLYLGWLRQRAGSLVPGMVMHFAYNGAIVVLGVG